MAPRSELALLGALILSSCRPAEPGGFRPRIDACATGTHTSWENTGRPITLAWCVPCHSGALVPDERQGAPEEVNFDDYEAVVLWADRIRVRATEAMDMPPMGGVPQEDLDALAEWIDCSLPGGTAATSGFCDAPDSTPGNQVASALACDAAVDIGGDLVVDVATDLDCVCSVGGDLTVTAPSASLPNLQRISGALHVDAAGVAVVTLPALTDAGALQLTGATSLSVLDVSELRRVEGEVSLADLPALPEIRFGSSGWRHR